mmetsp:Transcript_18920/g.72916  ORF Transcript_18920/g.72916 Transcript_18920/m.72916 type:complete len:213 (+) Transcript_18920:880-1518(+)
MSERSLASRMQMLPSLQPTHSSRALRSTPSVLWSSTGITRAAQRTSVFLPSDTWRSRANSSTYAKSAGGCWGAAAVAGAGASCTSGVCRTRLMRLRFFFALAARALAAARARSSSARPSPPSMAAEAVSLRSSSTRFASPSSPSMSESRRTTSRKEGRCAGSECQQLSMRPANCAGQAAYLPSLPASSASVCGREGRRPPCAMAALILCMSG